VTNFSQLQSSAQGEKAQAHWLIKKGSYVEFFNAAMAAVASIRITLIIKRPAGWRRAAQSSSQVFIQAG